MVVVLPFSGITPALSQLILKGGLVTMEGQLSMLVYGTTCTRALIFKQELRLAEDVGQPNILASLAYSTMFFSRFLHCKCNSSPSTNYAP